MDFFAQQEKSRKKTGLLLFYFCFAVAATIALVYLVPVAAWNAYQANYGSPHVQHALRLWNPDLFVLVCGTTLLVVTGGALFKIAMLQRGGGAGVATMLGGRLVDPGTADFFERRLRNVVEEMAIASGVRVPPVYVLDHEEGINAFAAGFTPSSSVVAVTYGTMTGLRRDELQGVIAHEFSHILNNDTRINISLMGILYGLLVIGLTGRILLEFVGRGTRVRRSSRNDSGQVIVFVVAAGLILWIVGSCGVLFAKLIKSAISRSRERLADASAVQFTRNPGGLAGALKKIGGLAQGSRIGSPHAEQASHMYFGNGVGSSLFSTHPPLKERVRWLEPTFDGAFPEVTLHDLREQLERLESAPPTQHRETAMYSRPRPAAAVLAAATPPRFRPNNPEALIDSIGKPMAQHADAARQLIDSIPETLKALARDPYGARALVYLLLLDAGERLRVKQLAMLEQKTEPRVFAMVQQALPALGGLRHEMRLPALDLALPALRFLSPAQYAEFRAVVRTLVEADEQVDVFEYALQRILVRHLDPHFGDESHRRPVNYYAIHGLSNETSAILSVLARKGTADDDEAQAAFAAGAGQITAPGASFELLPETECTWEAFDAALDKFAESSFKVRRWLLAAALACLMHDHVITVEEVELFRAVADSLDCPVPPWVVPSESAA